MIAEALAAYAKATARIFTVAKTLSALSEVGQCARKMFFAKNVGDRVYGAGSRRGLCRPLGRRIARPAV